MLPGNPGQHCTRAEQAGGIVQPVHSVLAVFFFKGTSSTVEDRMDGVSTYLALTFGTLLSSQGTDASFETVSPVSPGASLRCSTRYQTFFRFPNPRLSHGMRKRIRDLDQVTEGAALTWTSPQLTAMLHPDGQEYDSTAAHAAMANRFGTPGGVSGLRRLCGIPSSYELRFWAVRRPGQAVTARDGSSPREASHDHRDVSARRARDRTDSGSRSGVLGRHGRSGYGDRPGAGALCGGGSGRRHRRLAAPARVRGRGRGRARGAHPPRDRHRAAER